MVGVPAVMVVNVSARRDGTSSRFRAHRVRSMRQRMMPAVILPERAIWLWPWRRHAQGHLSATRVGSRAAASWVEEEHTARSKSALKQWALFCVALALWIAPGLLAMRIDLHAVEEGLGANPLRHASTTALVLAFALAYIVATGLLIAEAASRLTDGRPLYVK